MLSILKYKIKKISPKIAWNLASKLTHSYNEKRYKEIQKSYGLKNIEIKVFIIRRKPPAAGLFSNVNHVLQGLIYAENHNYAPVVDMRNYATEYSMFMPFNGTRNSWEYFFKPVSPINLSDAYKSKSVILSAGDRILQNHPMSGRNLSFAIDKQFIHNTNKIYDKYIQLNNFTDDYLNFISGQMQIQTQSTLGVFLRGTTYLSGLETGHPIQPKIEKVIGDIYEYLKSNPIKQILFSTDDSNLKKKIKREFGDLVIDDIRCDSEGGFSLKLRDKFNIPNKILARNLGYLSEIYILSKLRFNISSLSNGSAIMYIINGNKYEKSLIYNLGVK